MNLIGYWLHDVGDDEYIAPQEIVPPMPIELRQRVAEYLERGVRVRQYRGYSWCRYYCGLHHNGSGELSDGQWQWPDGLAHYVREHGVNLPGDFVHAALKDLPIDPELKPGSDLSEDLWLSWCRSNMNPMFRSQLAYERRIADMQVEAELKSMAARKQLEIGVSDNECAMARCSSRSLVGLAFCAKHVVDVDGSTESSLRLGYYSARNVLKRWSNYALERTDGTCFDVS